MTTDKIIGFRYLYNREYQEKIHDLTNRVMQENSEISLSMLKKSSLFSSAIKNLSADKQESAFNRIKDFAGESINRNELKVIMYLLDSNLEKVDLSEKFVMDGKFEVSEKSGIFEATKQEIGALAQLSEIYDFENGENFPTIDKNNVMTITDKAGNIVGKPVQIKQ